MLVACSAIESPAETPQLSVRGQLTSWGTQSPIDERHIVLCRIIKEPKDGLCDLMTSSAITDDQGGFLIPDVSPGSYFILYDSGLADFDKALEQWGGQTLQFGDMQWLSDFLGVNIETEPVEFRVPEGISHSPHQGWLTHYCTLTLSVGRSPFIIAHDMERAQEERELRCLIVEVLPDTPVRIEVQAAYFGDNP